MNDALLIVDDDAGLRMQLKWTFDRYRVSVAEDRETALRLARELRPTVVTVDLGLPPDPDGPSEGLRTISELLELLPDTKIIAITGQHDRANATAAIARGALDFFAKPFDSATLGVVVDRAFGIAQLQAELRAQTPGGSPKRAVDETASPVDDFTSPLNEPAPPGHAPDGVPGSPSRAPLLAGVLSGDASMLRVCQQILRLAPTRASVLLQGESGTGKELLARGLHEHSPRAARRFVAINCAAIPEHLLEAELFGHERGAFTGAVRGSVGRIESADGGTLFLDEIGDLPLPLQPKLLRFLQERVIERVGGRTAIPIDVRVVCATHRDLRAMTANGSFREDLYYRLAETDVQIPPLRERGDDCLLIAQSLIQRFAAELNRPTPRLSPAAAQLMLGYRWPGNVRELENALKRAVILGDGASIEVRDLPPLEASPDFQAASSDVRAASPEQAAPARVANSAGQPVKLRELIGDAQRQAVESAMATTGGNIARAARLLGISRPTLYEMLSRYGLRNREPGASAGSRGSD